jgi:hypothetical protein
MEGERNAAFQENAMLFATAVGCGLQGLGLETISANLMPVAVVREALWARKTPWFAAAACVGLAAGAASFLGPFLDRNAMASKPKPPEIDLAKREAKALTDRWKSVEAEYKADPRAESALNMARNRDTYAYLLNDLSMMMAAAKAKAPEEKQGTNRVVFRQWDTTFMASPYVPEDPMIPVAPAAPPGRAGATPEPVDQAADKPRVHCRLQIAITKPEAEADKLANEALVQWLNANRNRPGVPYTISIDLKKAMQIRREKVADAPATPPPGAQPHQPENDPEDRPAPVRPTGRAPRPGSGPQDRPGEGPRSDPGRLPFRNDPGSRPSQAPSKPGSDDVNKIAPLPSAEALGPPSTTVSYYTVEWDAVLKAPSDGQSKEGGQ